MTTMPEFAQIHGTRPRVESVAPAYARVWKQRPVGPSLVGFDGTDNSTGVSEVEYRRW